MSETQTQDGWRVADYNGKVTEEDYCPYWRCSERVDFLLHERVEDGEVVEAEKRCPNCDRTHDWADKQNRKTANKDLTLNRNANPTHGA